MAEVFSEAIRRLPQADIPIVGCTGYLSQAETHQLVFMTFEQDVDLPEHAHAAQWGVVLAGSIELVIGGVRATYCRGDTYTIPAGVKHSGRIFAGFTAMDFFDQPDRYRAK